MLKITMTETPTERKWVVQGCLVGPWVSELRTAWKRAHQFHDKRACVIDLKDVMSIDKSGKRLLRAMSKKGAQLIAAGMYVKHVLGQGREAIGGANAKSPSADRAARAEHQ